MEEGDRRALPPAGRAASLRRLERIDQSAEAPDANGLKPFKWLFFFRSQGGSYLALMGLDGKERISEAVEDTPDKAFIILGTNDDPTSPDQLVQQGTLNYDISEPGLMSLTGTLAGHPFSAKVKRVEVDDFQVVKRGFDWVNEYPHLE